MKILIIFDNPKRDQVGVINLSKELTKRGNEVFVTGLLTANVDVFYVRPDVVIHTYLRRNNLNFISKLAKSGVLNVVIESEGIVGEDIEGYLEFVSKCPRFEFISRYYCWGERQLEVLTTKFNNYSFLFKALGNPRFDELFLNSINNSFLKVRKNEPEYILVNTNFPNINPRFNHSASAEIRANVSVGHDLHVLLKKKEAAERVQDKLCTTIEKLSIELPNVQIVLRPHPFEDSEYYFLRFKNIDNIKVRSNGSSIAAIAKAGCLIQLNCTTALEATLLGVPVFMPDYFNEDILRYQASEYYSYKILSFEDLCLRIRDVFEGCCDQVEVIKSPLLTLPLVGSSSAIAIDISSLSSKGNFRVLIYSVYFILRFFRLKCFRSFGRKVVEKEYSSILSEKGFSKVNNIFTSDFLFKLNL